jgi:hypothetical protein
LRRSQAAIRCLHGHCVFLSIDEPTRPGETFRSVRDMRSSLDHTVAALGRALFAAGARLIMREHASYTPMLALLAAEYPVPPVAERASSEKEPVSRRSPLILAKPSGDRRPLAPVWETFRQSGLIGELTEPVLPELTVAVERFHPFAMIMVGGGDDAVEDEAVFRSASPAGLVVPLGFTGGRAAIRSREYDGDLGRRTSEIYTKLETLGRDWASRRRSEGETFSKEAAEERDFATYRPILATVQLLVRDLIERQMR